MRLRRVGIVGFKTFARRTEIVFDPGVTAVVGPNGSGKSNLVDAIRWALGETSARELRGGRMEEVIFAGGQGRPPLGMAEVEVVFDNEDGRLPLDDAEVAIGRRVTRGGESEFRLNGDRVRLRDLERLLAATGLTQSGYAVVAQNDIDAIIEATPQQRRALVEEAAGVRGLRTARDAAVARIDAAEVRLRRLADLLADAEPRLVELAAQAAVAREHAGLAARLAELRGSLAREEWRAARAEAKRARARLQSAIARHQAAEAAASKLAQAIETARSRLAAHRAQYGRAAAALEAARLEAERAAGDARRYLDQLGGATLQRATARLEVAAATDDVSTAASHVTDLGRAGAAAEAGLLKAESEVARRRAEVDAARVGAEAAAERLRRAEAEHGVADRERAAAAAALAESQARAALLDEAVERLAVEANGARTRAGELAEQAEEARRRAEVAQGEVARLREERRLARAAVEAAQREVAEARSHEAEGHRAAQEEAARVAALRGRMEALLGTGALADAIAAGRVVGRRLVDCITLRRPADGPAIEAALRSRLGAWIVDDLDTAAELLRTSAVAEEALAAQAEPVVLPDCPPGVRHGLEAVEVEPWAAAVVARCLERVWLAPDLPTAREAVARAGGVAVLPDGTCVTPLGIRAGGRPGETVELAALEVEAAARAAAAAAAATAARTRVERAASALATAEAEEGRLAKETEAAAAVAAEAAAVARAAIQAAMAERARAETVEVDRRARMEASAAARHQVATRSAHLEETTRAVEASRRRLEAATAVVSQAAAALTRAEAALREAELAAARAEPESRALQRRLATARQSLAAAEHRRRLAELRLVAAEETALVAVARIGAADARATAARHDIEASAALLDGCAGPVADAEAALAALEGEREAVAVAAARAADDRHAVEADVAACEARVAELARTAVAEVDDDVEPDAAAVERAEREIVRLERRIAALGPVNALAPEQHEALGRRVDGLRRDHDDLATAATDLRLVADHLEAEMERRFQAVFGAVAYHFRSLFGELFNGGRATLRLSQPPPEAADEPRPALSGVEILAQPPGKRLQPLSLLSGGERALTALAVIFALQQVNPSPFYVLDEVDAALDDVNIGRFLRLLRRLADTQQFVLVTHNHATMAAADCLYGVTIEGDGTSRVLGVRLVDGRPLPVAAPGRAVAAVG